MKPRLLFALLLMGFTSLIVQIILVREFLVCFYGNELTIGLILGNWIILEAIGSGLASRQSQRRRQPLSIYGLLQCLIALYFPVSIFLARTIKQIIPATTGEGIGIIPIAISSFFIIAPLSIFDGAQFPFGCRIWNDYTNQKEKSAGRVYIFEAIGFIIAGPLVTYFLLKRFNAMTIAWMLSGVNLLSCLFLTTHVEQTRLKKSTSLAALLMLGVFIGGLGMGVPKRLHRLSLTLQWEGYDIVDSQNSEYGNIAVTKEHEQYTFYQDGTPTITVPDPDITHIEEFVHFAMLAHPDPQYVLVIGGGAGGVIHEIVKYPIERCDYAEVDPLLFSMLRTYKTPLITSELTDPHVTIQITDGARFVKTSKQHYDVIFVNAPLPTTLQLNRLYVEEFFRAAERACRTTQSIVLCSLPGSLGYMGPELCAVNRSIFETVKRVFRFVAVIPGDTNLFLASNEPIPLDPSVYAQRLNKRHVATHLLTLPYFSYRLDPQWQRWFADAMKQTPNVETNTILNPKGVWYSLMYWNALFSPRVNMVFRSVEKIRLPILLCIIGLATLIVSLILRRNKLQRLPTPYAIATTGILGMSFDLIIIFSYQSFYGNVYHQIALIVTAFMAGLTLGGWLMTQKIAAIKNKRTALLALESGLIAYALALIPAVVFLGSRHGNYSVGFFALSACSGLLIGAEFPLANSLYARDVSHTAGILYALDLIGSWIGAVVVAILFVPVLGLLQTCLVLAAIKCSSVIFIAISRRQALPS